MFTSPRRRHAVLAGTVAALSLLLPQSPAQAAPEPVKIHKEVQADLAKDDKATFLVRLKGKADLALARTAKNKDDKAKQVYRAKTERAASSQASLRRLLKAKKVPFTPFWVVNAIKVTGDAALAAEIAKMPEVAGVEPDRTLTPPKPRPGTKKAAKLRAPVEWNISRIGAPRAWNELGARGDGIVVANIDSGVDYNHPALKAQYRGTKADGTVDHGYNWFDPSGTCTGGAPCDNDGHGTHTMGTMVGDGIGVAPGAKWIAAKGCGAAGCSTADLLASGQWMLAPTDASGLNPRPDLAPDVVNNSWGSDAYDPFFAEVVQAWITAGIFPAFANGNAGPACGTAGSPGNYTSAYAAGAFDSGNAIAAFSSRGAGEGGELKPNISAPGSDIWSAVPGGTYVTMSGTSMASPHVAGAVALIWSASATVNGDVAATRALLDQTAVDVADTTCGGTAADNNVWGEGRLDAYAAVRSVSGGQAGGLRGAITSAGSPVAGASLSAAGPVTRTVTSGQDGAYTMANLPVGEYRLTATKFGYTDATATATVTAGQTAVMDLTLTAKPTGAVTGTISADGAPHAGATVTVTGTRLEAVADASGRYSLSLPHGDYDLKVTGSGPSGPCLTEAAARVTVAGDVAKDFTLAGRTDTFGHTCKSAAEAYVAGTRKRALTGDDTTERITLPFAFPFYGRTYTSGWVASNGYLNLGANASDYANASLPTGIANAAAVYPFWDDLVLDAQSGLYTATTGTAPRRTFVIEWRNVKFYDVADRLSFSLLLGEDGSIGFRYKGIAGDVTAGGSATVGIEGSGGTDALQYAFNRPALTAGQGLTFAPGRR
ncbi:S8 family serine peptidase [Sinosporangium siamense]|uniref:Peptidase S8 n=1 Tax=Sinosporangium siamense TaxID=1367973 RepID=A0A919RMB7_9ACTN|nr:S8 family serine peptidase [Sinosporangium siamense]GII96426.1 peptidase S8 [Sinosporangium siamense]